MPTPIQGNAGLDPATEEVCQVLLEERVYIKHGSNRLPQSFQDPQEYLRQCHQNLDATIKEQKNKGEPHWTAASARQVVRFAKNSNLLLVAFSPNFVGRSPVPFMLEPYSDGKSLLVWNLMEPAFENEGTLLHTLIHEEGHDRDLQLLLSELGPEDAAFVKAIRSSKHITSLEDARRFAKIYYNLLKDRVPESDQEYFEALFEKYFGDLDHLNKDQMGTLLSLFTETLRYGEEIQDHEGLLHDSLFKQGKPQFNLFFHPAYRLPVPGSGRYTDYRLPLIAAKLKVTGYWDEFVEKGGLKVPEDKINPELLDFFMMGIKAARRYQGSQRAY